MNLLRLFNRPTAVNDNIVHDETITCTLHNPDKVPLEATRTHCGGGGTSVYAWPSSGGVWVHESCYGVELDLVANSIKCGRMSKSLFMIRVRFIDTDEVTKK